MMRLDLPFRLDNIRVNCALDEVVHAFMLGLFFKDSDEKFACDLSLFFWVAHPSKCTYEPFFRVDNCKGHKVKRLLDLFGLALPH